MRALGQTVVKHSSTDDSYRAHNPDYSDTNFCVYVTTQNSDFDIHATEYL